MGAVKRKKVAKIQTSYVKQQEIAEINIGKRRKRLFRRLSVFFIGVVAVSFFMISTLVSQSATLEKQATEKQKLDKELKQLKQEGVYLEEEIVRLNDDEYIAKLARKDYFLSEPDEMIFSLPEKKIKNGKGGNKE